MGNGYFFLIFQLIENQDSCNKPFVLSAFWPVKASCHVLEPDDFEVNIKKRPFFEESGIMFIHYTRGYFLLASWLGWVLYTQVDATYKVGQEGCCQIDLYLQTSPSPVCSTFQYLRAFQYLINFWLCLVYSHMAGANPNTQRSNTQDQTHTQACRQYRGDQAWCSPEKPKVTKAMEG